MAEVRLRKAKGVWKGALRRGSFRPAKALGAPSDPQKTLSEELDRLAKKFKKKVRQGIPARKSEGLDEAVHELRTATRRLLAHLLAVEPLGNRKVRRSIRVVRRVLGWTGPLRDAAVEEERIRRMRPPASAVKGFIRDLRLGQGRRATRLNRRLAGVRAGKIRRIIRRFSRALGKRKTTVRKIPRIVERTFDGIRKARLALDPADPGTLHELRIAIKHFRYLMETLEASLPGRSGSSVEALHELQRTLGGLHDLEVLASRLSARVKKRPDRAAGNAKVLERLEGQHSLLYRSFLKSVDPILESWKERVAAFRTSGSREGANGTLRRT